MAGTANQLQSPVVLENAGVVFTNANLIPFTSASTTVYSLNAAYSVTPDGTIISGISVANVISGTISGFTAIDYGSCVKLISLGSTYSDCTSIIGNSIIEIGAGNVSNTSPLLTNFSMPNLVYAGNGTGFAPIWASLTTLNLPSLRIIAASFTPSLASCTSLLLPSLQNVGTGFGIITPVLTTLSLPALKNVGSNFTITAANMTTFSMNSGLLFIGGSFLMTGMKLNQASVDGILVRLAALDGTNGTTAYSNKTINLSGGTSSAPSATGLTAKTTLQGRGCTVTTN